MRARLMCRLWGHMRPMVPVAHHGVVFRLCRRCGSVVPL